MPRIGRRARIQSILNPTFILILVTGSLALIPVRAADGVPRRPPNIIFILIDDMGWADGDCFGSKFYQTPELSRLAAEGMRFTQAYAACAVCSPTRAALMTGKAPARLHITDWIAGEGAPKNSRFRVPNWQQHLPLVEITIAEVLKPLGYRTAAIGKWHLGGPGFFPENQGFDVNIAGRDIGHPASYWWPYGQTDASHRVTPLAETGGRSGEYLTDRLTDEALRFVEANQANPFFLYLAHYAVHAPLMGKEGVAEKYRQRGGANGQSNAVYAAMLQSVDDSVGRVLEKVRALGLSDRTIIIFTSDNGGAVHLGKPPATSNAPLRDGKGTAYEGGLRVPLLVKIPGTTRPGSVCTTPVITQDWFPTLLELAGGARNSAANLDGVSLVPLLRGQGTLMERDLFWHYPHYWNGGKVSPYSVVRSGDWKLIRFYETDREEIYNLHDDLSETNDLASREVDRKRDLGGRLDRWLHSVGAQMHVKK